MDLNTVKSVKDAVAKSRHADGWVSPEEFKAKMLESFQDGRKSVLDNLSGDIRIIMTDIPTVVDRRRGPLGEPSKADADAADEIHYSIQESDIIEFAHRVLERAVLERAFRFAGRKLEVELSLSGALDLIRYELKVLKSKHNPTPAKPKVKRYNSFPHGISGYLVRRDANGSFGVRVRVGTGTVIEAEGGEFYPESELDWS